MDKNEGGKWEKKVPKLDKKEKKVYKNEKFDKMDEIVLGALRSMFIYQHFSRIEVIGALRCIKPTLRGCDAW